MRYQKMKTPSTALHLTCLVWSHMDWKRTFLLPHSTEIMCVEYDGLRCYPPGTAECADANGLNVDQDPTRLALLYRCITFL